MTPPSEQSGQSSPRVDDARNAEVEGTVRGGHGNRVEEWRDPEPSGEDQPPSDRDPVGFGSAAPPPGMAPGDVEVRTETARFLGTDSFPADRERLVAVAQENQATDAVLDRLRGLPGDREYTNLQEVMFASGVGVEDHRF